MRVVIVEDEDVIRNGLSNLVCKINNDIEVVATVNNGSDAIEKINRTRPDLVITDIKMPKLDGLEMLNQLKAKGINHKTIILSAYSEFEYAQQAIKLGVNEYILKPISVIDMTQALKNIEDQIVISNKLNEKENEKNLSLNDILKRIVFTEDINEFEIKELLKVKYNINYDEKIGIFVLYTSMYLDEYIVNLKKRLKDIFKSNYDLECFIIENKEKNEIVILFLNLIENRNVLEGIIEKFFINKDKKNWAVGYARCNGIINIKSTFNSINENLEWNLSMTDKDIVYLEKINNIYTLPIYYPIDIESELRNNICNMNFEEIKKGFNKFISYSKRDLYNPKEIKNNLIRFLWAVINITKEINNSEELNIDTQRLLTSLMLAKTWNEIEYTFNTLLKYIGENITKNNEERYMSLLVKRAKSLAYEFYSKGITLEEISDKLNVTPEYLGTQFKKEVGESFSIYIKKYRINKAKKLLLSTNLRLYQISERVGYNDPKYFSKVFKESTNYLPLEYKKLYK